MKKKNFESRYKEYAERINLMWISEFLAEDLLCTLNELKNGSLQIYDQDNVIKIAYALNFVWMSWLEMEVPTKEYVLIYSLLEELSCYLDLSNDINLIFDSHIENALMIGFSGMIHIAKKFGWRDKFGILKKKKILTCEEMYTSELIAELISDEEKRELSKMIVTTKNSETRRRL